MRNRQRFKQDLIALLKLYEVDVYCSEPAIDLAEDMSNLLQDRAKQNIHR